MSTSKKHLARLRRKNRIRATVSGIASKPRLVVYRSNQYITAQLIDDQKGVTLAEANDITVKKGTKTERAVQVGQNIAAKAEKAKINTCVFDRNGYQYHGRVKALADAAREAGLQF